VFVITLAVFRHILAARSRRHVQRRIAVFVLAENQIRIVFEQYLDRCQVTSPSSVKNESFLLEE
jgi:hypothetical protein